MLFVIDIGNTNLVLGLFDGETRLAQWRVATIKNKTTDEYGILFRELFRSADLPIESVSGVIISSVVPPLTSTISQTCQSYFGRRPLIVGPGIKTGMPILYDNPKEVGADRIVNAIAAYNRHKCGLIIVDFGTATTFDVVTEKGEYLGGMIAPGISISMDALFLQTAQLPRFEFKQPKHVIGRNTIESMQSGIYYGYVGLVDGIVRKLQAQSPAPAKVIATGGLAPIIANGSETIDSLDEGLTLEGLRIIWELNRKQTS
jgi:type III pantothenate kinase